MNERLERLEKWLAKHRPAFLASMRPGATSEELSRFTDALGVPPPDALVRLLAWHNGQDPEGPAMQYDRRLLGIDEILAERTIMSELLKAGEIGMWDNAYVPFMRSWGADLVCIDTAGHRGLAGEVFVRTCEDELYPPDYPNLETWLDVFVTTLEAGVWKDVGDFLPRDDGTLEATIARLAPGYPVAGDEVADGR